MSFTVDNEDTTLFRCNEPDHLVSLRYSYNTHSPSLFMYYSTPDDGMVGIETTRLGQYSTCLPPGLIMLHVMYNQDRVIVLVDVDTFEDYPLYKFIVKEITTHYFSTELAISPSTEWRISQTFTSDTWWNLGVDDRLWPINEPLNDNPTAYYRLKFEVEIPPEATALVVHVKYRGGFNAYSNGYLVGQFNLPDNVTFSYEAAHQNVTEDRFTIPIFNGTIDHIFLALEFHREASQPFFTPSIQALFQMVNPIRIAESYTIYSQLGTFSYGDDITTIGDELIIPFQTSVEAINLRYTSRNKRPVVFDKISFGNSEESWLAKVQYQDAEMERTVSIDTAFNPVSFSQFDYQLTIGYRPLRYRINRFELSLDVMKESCQFDVGYFALNTTALVPCPEGFYGARLAMCTKNGTINDDRYCRYKAPVHFEYTPDHFTIAKGVLFTSPYPTQHVTLTSFRFTYTDVPDGLVIDEKTGVISGKPTQLVTNFTLYVCGRNRDWAMCSPGYVIITVYDPSKVEMNIGNSTLALASAPSGFSFTLYRHGLDARGLDTLIQQFSLVIPYWLICCCVGCSIVGVVSLILIRKRRKTHPRLPVTKV